MGSKKNLIDTCVNLPQNERVFFLSIDETPIPAFSTNVFGTFRNVCCSGGGGVMWVKCVLLFFGQGGLGWDGNVCFVVTVGIWNYGRI